MDETNLNTPQESPGKTTGVKTQVAPQPLQPATTFPLPKYYDFLALALGALFAVISSLFYSGRYLLPDTLTSLIKNPAKEDNITPPGIGFDYNYTLKEIPKKVFGFGPQVKILGIEGGSINKIPGEISELSGLTRFEVRNSHLKTLPDNLQTLSELTVLDFGGNKLASLPEMGDLQKVTKLYLYNNKIKALPESLGTMFSLEVLDLHSNKLKSLPSSLGNLPNLKLLFLGDNPIPQTEKDKIRNMLPNTQIFF